MSYAIIVGKIVPSCYIRPLELNRTLLQLFSAETVHRYSKIISAEKPNILSRHNVVYVDACSFDNPLGGFVPGTKLNQLDFRAESAI